MPNWQCRFSGGADLQLLWKSWLSCRKSGRTWEFFRKAIHHEGHEDHEELLTKFLATS
jgi:hypothetical protein